MKLTKARFQKIINNVNNQTKRKHKKNIKILNHNNTLRNKKQFNLRNVTLKNL